MTPQIIYLCLLCIGIGSSLAQHGTPETGDHNFIVDFIGYLITFCLLCWGGFFSPLGL